MLADLVPDFNQEWTCFSKPNKKYAQNHCADCLTMENRPIEIFERCLNCHAAVCPTCILMARPFHNLQHCGTCSAFLCAFCFRFCFLFPPEGTIQVHCISVKPPTCHIQARSCPRCEKFVCMLCFPDLSPHCQKI